MLTSQKVGQILAANLITALKVAGPQDSYGRPSRLRSSQIQKTSGIARSTLRALKSCSENFEPNPDLRTLSRIANELEVPVAFLLMGPTQWRLILSAFEDMAQMLAAADQVDEASNLSGPEGAVQILRALKVYPLRPPSNYAHALNISQRDELQIKNEKRRRSALVTAALTQTGVRDRKFNKKFTALAASLANQITN